MAEKDSAYRFPRIGKGWWLAIAGAILLFYYLVDPVQSRFIPQCLFHRFTGLQCVGCGSQRVLHALMHGDFAGAFRANALLVVSIPFLICLVLLEINRKRYPGLYAGVHNKWFIITVGGVMILWMIIRNLLGI